MPARSPACSETVCGGLTASSLQINVLIYIYIDLYIHNFTHRRPDVVEVELVVAEGDVDVQGQVLAPLQQDPLVHVRRLLVVPCSSRRRRGR